MEREGGREREWRRRESEDGVEGEREIEKKIEGNFGMVKIEAIRTYEIEKEK